MDHTLVLIHEWNTPLGMHLSRYWGNMRKGIHERINYRWIYNMRKISMLDSTSQFQCNFFDVFQLCFEQRAMSCWNGVHREPHTHTHTCVCVCIYILPSTWFCQTNNNMLLLCQNVWCRLLVPKWKEHKETCIYTYKYRYVHTSACMYIYVCKYVLVLDLCFLNSDEWHIDAYISSIYSKMKYNS